MKPLFFLGISIGSFLMLCASATIYGSTTHGELPINFNMAGAGIIAGLLGAGICAVTILMNNQQKRGAP